MVEAIKYINRCKTQNIIITIMLSDNVYIGILKDDKINAVKNVFN